MRVILKETPPNTYSPRAQILSDDGRQVIGEVGWVAGYGHPDEAERRAEAIAHAHRFAASDDLLAALIKCRDEYAPHMPEPVRGLAISFINKTIAAAEPSELVSTPVAEGAADDEVDDNPFHPESPEGRAWDRGDFKKD